MAVSHKPHTDLQTAKVVTEHISEKVATEIAPACGADLSTLVAVIVTHHPDIPILARELEALPPESAVVLVDNASGSDTVIELNSLIAPRSRAHIIQNDANRGLAAAVNQGVRQAKYMWQDIQFVLLLDQDSEPTPGSIEKLAQAYDALSASGATVGCVGPALLDASTGMHHGFHQSTHWRWRRVRPASKSIHPVTCTNLNGSGTLMRIDLFFKLGGLDEALFIDHVDTEWAFRVLAAGHSLWGIPNATFTHSMGERGMRFWFFGWHVWPSRAPLRHYFLFRNAAILMRRDYVPRTWKFWAAVKLLLTVGIHVSLDARRGAQLRCMLRGLKDGIHSRSTPLTS